MRVLCGDVGGTKTALAVYDREGERLQLVVQARYASAEAPGLWPLIDRFLAEHPQPAIDSAAFAVAGPVIDGRCNTTNLPWQIDQAALTAALRVPVSVVNDFYGVALGAHAIVHAPANTDAPRLLWWQPGARDEAGVMAVLGAGTGLGAALLVPGAAGPRVVAGEGGHVDFAPRSELELDLLRFLWTRHARVSVERVVSGPGLVRLHEFLVTRGHATSHASTLQRLASEDPAAVIGALGLAGADPACTQAVELFAGIYGATAGNIAVHSLPRGGLILAGGVTLHLHEKLREPFMAAFMAKGRMAKVLEQVPVAVCLDPDIGLQGAALAAPIP